MPLGKEALAGCGCSPFISAQHTTEGETLAFIASSVALKRQFWRKEAALRAHFSGLYEMAAENGSKRHFGEKSV